MSKKVIACVSSKPHPPRPNGFCGENFRPGSLPMKITRFFYLTEMTRYTCTVFFITAR